MAAQSWGADPRLVDLLFQEGYRFEFFQAVRLLERLFPERQPVGRDADPGQEIVRLRALLSLSFPPSAIHEIAPAKDGHGPAQMTVAFMGLTGPLGVLPRHYTELLLERVRHKDQALRDFLDLFNHRLIAFFYRAWEKYRVPIVYEQAVARQEGLDSFSHYLFDLMGMGTTGLRGRLDIDDETFLYYAGLLAQRPHSASALAGILTDYFEVPVTVRQLVGEWLPLDADQRSRLGARDGNAVLGASTVAGDRVWDQQAKVTVRVGPLTYADFCRFLPAGEAFRRLVAMSRFYVGQEFDVDVQLILKAAEVPWCRLGDPSEQAPRLGWSAWLKVAEFDDDVDDAILTGQMSDDTGKREMITGASGREAV
jgi:type VI secretion system protein ImpH